MASSDKEIIDLRPEKPDEGEIRYTFQASSKPPANPDPFKNLLAKIFGIAIGVGIFLLLLFFFVYVVLPIIAIFIVWMLLRRLLGRR